MINGNIKRLRSYLRAQRGVKVWKVHGHSHENVLLTRIWNVSVACGLCPPYIRKPAVEGSQVTKRSQLKGHNTIIQYTINLWSFNYLFLISAVFDNRNYMERNTWTNPKGNISLVWFLEAKLNFDLQSSIIAGNRQVYSSGFFLLSSPVKDRKGLSSCILLGTTLGTTVLMISSNYS